MNNILYETIADIAYTAGVHRYYSGDSRADMAHFVYLANEFEKQYEGVVWDNADMDYMEAIESFIKSKLVLNNPVNFVPAAAKEPWDCIEIEAIHDDGTDACPVDHLENGDYPVSYHSVYLHQKDGGVNCIADVPTEEDAIKLRELIETVVRTFTRSDNTDFINVKEKLLVFLSDRIKQSSSDTTTFAYVTVKRFVEKH